MNKPLTRILGVGDGWALVVGAVIGLGILRTPGPIAGYLGTPMAILSVWAVGGFVVLGATAVFAELATMFPEPGGKFVYAERAFGPVAGFVTGWGEILVTRGFSAASKAIVIAEYFVLLTGWGAIRPLAAGVVISFFLVNAAGLKAGRTFQNVVTILKVAVIVAIVIAGFLPGPGPEGSSLETVTGFGGWGGFALAYLAVAFTYYGWDDGLKMAGEFKDPGRALPRILLGGAGIVAVLYLLINLAFLSALTPEQMAGSPLVAADVVAKVAGETGRRFVTVAALVILVSSCNVQFLGLPRVAFGLAQHGLAPMAFTRTDGRGTPMAGLCLVAGFVFLMAMTGSFLILIQFLSVTALMIDGIILAGLFRLRRTHADHDRPFAVPWYPWLPGATLAAFAGLFLVILFTQPAIVLGGAAILATLVFLAVLWLKVGKGSP